MNQGVEIGARRTRGLANKRQLQTVLVIPLVGREGLFPTTDLSDEAEVTVANAANSVISNPMPLPKEAWIAMLQTPMFKGLIIGAGSLLVVCRPVAQCGGWGGHDRLSTVARALVGEVAAAEPASTFLAQTGEPDEADKKVAGKDPTDDQAAADAADKVAHKIQKTMEHNARADFVEAPLTDALDWLKDEHEIPIVLDKAALKKEGVDPHTLINVNLQTSTLRSGMKFMLEPLGLTAIPKRDSLFITTRKKAASEAFPHHYHVEDILDIKGGTMEDLAATIRASVVPKKWKSETNPEAFGEIKSVGKTLVIIQTDDAHQHVVKLLEQLRAKRK